MCVFRDGWEFTAQPAQLRHFVGVPPFPSRSRWCVHNRRTFVGRNAREQMTVFTEAGFSETVRPGTQFAYYCWKMRLKLGIFV